MKSRYQELIAACDADIRAGRISSVAKRLARLDTARVPREAKAPLAKICRRAGLYSQGLALLARLIHPTKGHGSDATQIELAGYAALLLRSGAIQEALNYLSQVDTAQVPEALLTQAFGHFMRWEFAAAVEPLEAYLKMPLAEYDHLVAKTNLAYALTEIRDHERALSVLEPLVRKTQAEGHKVLEYNCRAYRAQVYVQQGELQRARHEIESTPLPEEGGRSNDLFVFQKWKMIVDGLEQRDPAQFFKLSKMAAERCDWAALREADLFSLKVDHSPEKILHLYFGSPFPEFRRRIEQEFGFVAQREFYVLGAKRAPRLDLATGTLDGKPLFKAGSLTHQLIGVLLQDFYQPMRVAALFSALFPHEHFMISSSPDRIHQILRRTRRIIEENRVPLQIIEEGGFYSLKISREISFRIQLDHRRTNMMEHQFDSLRAAFGSARFSAREARERLKVSKATVRRLILWSIENGKVEVSPELSSVPIYEFTAQKSKKAA